MEKAIIGAILKKRIKECNMTQEEFAEKVGIGYSTLKKYLNGQNVYNYELLLEFANELNCSCDYLMGRTKSPNPEYKEIRDKIHLSDKAISILIDRTNKSMNEDEQDLFMETLQRLIEDENIIDKISSYFAVDKTINDKIMSMLGLNTPMDKLPIDNDTINLMDIMCDIKILKQTIPPEMAKRYQNAKLDLKSLAEIVQSAINTQKIAPATE